jgi:hypothetical protein
MESFALPQAQARWPGQRVLREGCAGVSCFCSLLFHDFSCREGLSGHQVMLIK